MKTVIDTYAWIEIFIGSESGKKVKEILQKAEEAYTPDVVVAEIARKYLREGMEERAIHQRLTTIEETSEITPVDKNIAIESARCYLELAERAGTGKLKTPSLFDAIVLATARIFDAKLVTGDEHFKGINGILWVGET